MASPKSESRFGRAGPAKGLPLVGPGLCFLLLAAWSSVAVWFFYRSGAILYYGDAEAHLNMARRVLDSQTPGYDQIGRIWLPLPHLLMLPLVQVDALWRTGLAGSIPSGICYAIAGTLLFATARRVFGAAMPAAVSVALFAANPNLLYLQSVPMGEAVFIANAVAVLYFTVVFRSSGSGWAAAGAGIASSLAALTRYEGWFVIPFVAAYFLWSGKKRRVPAAAVYAALAAIGPLYWLFHNWWLTGDVLDFYRGPNSPLSIQGLTPYPGHGNWPAAFLYYGTAATLCAGSILMVVGLAGIVSLLLKRAFWPVFFLALPGIFYVWSIHSAAIPIYVPSLSHSYYNTRYGTAILPLLALASGGLVAIVPGRLQIGTGVLLVALVAGYWAVRRHPEQWITWKEASVNSEARRQWSREAAEYLKPRYIPGSGLITSFGDLTAIYRLAGIPLKETFTADNGLVWSATVKRPDLFLWQEWAVAFGGDDVQSGINRAGRYGIRYRLEKSIVAGTEPVVEIYRRIGSHEDSLYQSSRRQE
ncbi:MAG: glycosyltransferase family 39 protein [Acidobacteriia bacterium]|nr:glycosyltransferase family 39 protein [Terriglobia bacterium]